MPFGGSWIALSCFSGISEDAVYVTLVFPFLACFFGGQTLIRQIHTIHRQKAGLHTALKIYDRVSSSYV